MGFRDISLCFFRLEIKFELWFGLRLICPVFLVVRFEGQRNSRRQFAKRCVNETLHIEDVSVLLMFVGSKNRWEKTTTTTTTLACIYISVVFDLPMWLPASSCRLSLCTWSGHNYDDNYLLFLFKLIMSMKSITASVCQKVNTVCLKWLKCCRLIGSGCHLVCIRRGPITNEIGDKSSGQPNLYPFIGKRKSHKI